MRLQYICERFKWQRYPRQFEFLDMHADAEGSETAVEKIYHHHLQNDLFEVVSLEVRNLDKVHLST